MKKNNYKFPNLIFEEFFSGKVEAAGHLIQYFPRKKKKNLFINFKGNFKNNILHINENYREEKVSSNRNWKFIKIQDNRFLGEEKNVSGKIEVDIKKNSLYMNYIFTVFFKKLPIKVYVEDSMHLVSKTEIINFTVISKYKFKLAETFLLYKKKS